MERFEWQTEEEGPLAPVVAPAPTRGGRWLAVALIVVSLAAAAILMAWQVGRRLEAHEQAVKQDVQATFGVWRQAVTRRDSDLLGTLLVDGEAQWTAVQRALLASGRTLDRPGIGLTMVESDLEAAALERDIDVSRDWRSAEVTFPLTYSWPRDDGRAGDVRLLQTMSLVREGSRWLLRRPDEEFWGIWHTLAGRSVAVTYRERDAEIARSFLDDLDRDLGAVCSRVMERDRCPTGDRVEVRLESEAEVLLKDIDQRRPAFAGRTFVLPSPTLVGKPLDEAGYEALYALYAGPILSTYEASLTAPVDLPAQMVMMVCFERHGNLPRLFRYDPAANIWSSELNGNAFRFLTASADDERIALRQHMPREPNRFKVVQYTGGQASVLRDETYSPLTDHSIGWVETAGQSSLLLAEYQGTSRQPAYQLIGPDGKERCPEAGCQLQALDGFPNWAPDGAHSLAEVGESMYLADGDGRAEIDLGEGHDGFWLDNRHFGFIRPAGNDQYQVEELVVGSRDAPELRAIWSTDALDAGILGSTTDKPFYVQHIALSGGRQNRLLLYGRQYASDASRYAILSLALDIRGDETALISPARLELALDQSPASFPSAADPTGHAPFVVSPDGRWLTVAHLAERGNSSWVIDVVEIGRSRGLRFRTDYPGYSFKHPFFDWSADERWLLIVDEGFIRLVAPEANFDRIVAHDKRNCAYPAWLDRWAAD